MGSRFLFLKEGAGRGGEGAPHLLLLLELIHSLHHFRDVMAKAQVLERFDDMLVADGLLGLPLSNFVCLGRYERDELHAAFDQQVARVAAIRHARVGREDLIDDLLHRCCRQQTDKVSRRKPVISEVAQAQRQIRLIHLLLQSVVSISLWESLFFPSKSSAEIK